MHAISCDLWLMERNAMRQFSAMCNSLVNVSTEQIRAATKATQTSTQQKNVAVIPVHGTLEARPTFLGELLGMTSYEAIGVNLDIALRDESVGTIVFDISSPGGMVYGAQELADKIYRSRAIKPSIAVANPMAASGAYWIGSAATRMVMTPSSDVGSVGVIGAHEDNTDQLASEGIKVTYVLSEGSPYKGEMAQPLTDEAKSNMQSRANAIYQQFTSDLARFRGVPVEIVTEKYGKGRLVGSKQAMSAGMVDSVGTLQDIVGKLLSGRIKLGTERAQDNWDAPSRMDVRRELVKACLSGSSEV